MQTKEIKSIAKVVRTECEIFAESNEAYDEYDFYHEHDLRCMCAFASFLLYKVLSSMGFEAKFVEGYYDSHGIWGKEEFTDNERNHCWVECNDHIVDITATQFYSRNGKRLKSKVRMIKFTGQHYYHGVSIGTKGLSDWPKRQQPKKKVIEELVKKVVDNRVAA